MKFDENTKILIVGLGLIGGSYARALTEKGFETGVIDVDQKAIDYALAKGWIKSGQTQADKDYVSRFDVVVFAVYPKTLIAWLEQYRSFIKSGALVTDVSGVKGCVVYKAQELLQDRAEFIGAHPMAGREVSGVEHANPAIFKGANFIVVPTDKNTQEGIEGCKELARLLGFGKISVLSPEQHDEMAGFLSHLTHCIAVSLMVCKDSTHLASYTGDSFRDLTRIAKINDDMWSELFLLNKDELLAQMNLFEEHFNALKKYIESDDRDAIREMMRISASRRKVFDKDAKQKK